MATHKGNPVFLRGVDDDDDETWDDTALIKAYDNAISSMKAQMFGESHDDATEKNSSKRKHKKNKRKQRQQKQTSKKQEWSVGDLCQAVFSEDGSVYDAVIKDIDESTGTCTVLYIGYGNEEEQVLDDLTVKEEKEKHKSSHRQRHHSVTSEESTNSKQSTNQQTPSRPPFSWPGAPSSGTMPPPPPPFNMPAAAGYGAPSMPPPPVFPGWPGTAVPPRLPSIPPPPMMPLMSDLSQDDTEALCSMLMSWYMSGYHTGYYQGLKEDRTAKNIHQTNKHGPR